MTIATALRLPRETVPLFAVIEIEFLFDEAVEVWQLEPNFGLQGTKSKGRVGDICSYLRCGELRTAKRQEAVQ